MSEKPYTTTIFIPIEDEDLSDEDLKDEEPNDE